MGREKFMKSIYIPGVPDVKNLKKDKEGVICHE
jgi:hypothetical protein